MSRSRISDEELIEAIERLQVAGVTDAHGGVPVTEISDEVGLVHGAVSDRVRRLTDVGLLEREWGFGPNGPRLGYSIPDHIEVDEVSVTEMTSSHGPTQDAILAVLESADEMRPAAVAAELDKSMGACSSALYRLHQKDIVERRPDPDDPVANLYRLEETAQITTT